MSTIIKFELKELKKLTSDKTSCVIEKKVTQNLALRPWCLGNLKESIKSLLDYKIGKFDKEFNGIVLSYKDLRVLQNIGSIRNDNADVHFEVQADYFIFQPYVGATLRGIVNKKSSTHLGILVHRVFNVVIPRPTEQPGNKWIGSSINQGQEVVFKVVVLDLYGALPYIRGKIDENWMKKVESEVQVSEDKMEVVNVSHVNFDKTKPSSPKQVMEQIAKTRQLHTLPKKKLKNSSLHPCDSTSTAKKTSIQSVTSKLTTIQNKMIKNDKSVKKLKDSEIRNPDVNSRLPKKRKKDPQ